MPERVTVKEVWNSDAPELYQGQHGMIYEYKLTLADGRFAVIGQKADTPAPFAGQALEADMKLLKEGGKMWKLWNVKRLGADNVSQTSHQSPQAVSQPQAGYEVSDIRQRLIIRQNALNRATDEALAKGESVVAERVEFFESLVWRAASADHEKKVLVWAGVAEAPRANTQTNAQTNGKASAATLAQLLKASRTQGVSDLEFSNFVTSLGAESVNDLSEEQAQKFLTWLTNGEERAA